MSSGVPRLARIDLHPIKSLDPVSVSEARIGPSGGLEHDRAWALYSAEGRWVNGKRTAAIHLIRASYAPDLSSVTLNVPAQRGAVPAASSSASSVANPGVGFDAPRIAMPSATFPFPDGHDAAAEWFSEYFQQRILVRYSLGGYPDDTEANGPTIVSTASLAAVCEWFPGIALAEARRRFRTTLELDGVPAFWEDQLFGPEKTSIVRFRIGEVEFEGSNPCARCPVPPRNPLTGEDLVGFQQRFVAQRRANLPAWSHAGRFDHFYRFTTNTRVAVAECGKTLRVGDALEFF
ncbi:MAG: MOSC N-terminal beta barrel domain-containing protein [Candidatus Acidiferrales bacterium]